ncbi:MAG: hydroxylamine reductase [Thermoguttaceae bacterium]
MYCYQCEQTFQGKGCTKVGVCGKESRVADLQDVLVFVVKKLGVAAHAAAQAGVRDDVIDRFVVDALFTTVTNVDFDEESVAHVIMSGTKMPDRLSRILNGKANFPPPPVGDPDASVIDNLLELAPQHGLAAQKEKFGDTVAGLQHLILFGLKGAAAYAHHAAVLGKTDPKLFAEFHAVLAFLDSEPTDVDALLATALRVGKINYIAMEILDEANKTAYGKPTPKSVRITPVAGKAILVSGHDLRDLESILKQTEGKGINVYTHGEMLPCHGYPKLAAFPHLVGNYGGAWQDQRREFDEFPGAIVLTTNCIQKPQATYNDRIFTSGLVRFPGVSNIQTEYDGTKDWQPVIDAALAAPGFDKTADEKTITVGFGGDAVLGVADKVIAAVKSGAIKHFFLIGGCDGAKTGRNYYTDFAMSVPKDSVILTLACGKYRFNKESFGDIGGIPRLLDIGQCNDAFSAIKIAVALSEAFGCGVNDLPLSLVLSWYEQKAVAILLTLLELDIRNIRLGPSLPAFLTADAINVLVEKFAIKPIGNAADDLNACLAKK